MAQQRALEALQQTGGMAGNLRSEDLSRANAMSAIDRFNAAQRASANQNRTNIGLQRYGSIQGKASDLRNRQKEGEQAIGGLLSGAAGIISPIKF
jgi:hypothetical protein